MFQKPRIKHNKYLCLNIQMANKYVIFNVFDVFDGVDILCR